MNKIGDIAKDLIVSSLPLASGMSLSLSTLSHIARPDLKDWEPAFYSFLPMCFFFVGWAIFVSRQETRREIRELRDTIAKLRA
jgi:hypothetical protein